MIKTKKLALFSTFAVSTLFLLGFLITPSLAITTDEIMAKVKDEQLKIQDQESYYTQTIQMNMLGNKPMIEQGKYYKKQDKIRKDITEPSPKTTITTSKVYYELDKKTGKIIKYNLDDIKNQPGMNQPANMNPEEIMKQYNFSLKNEDQDNYVLSGQYQDNQLDIYVSKTDFVTKKMVIIMKNKPYMTINLEYQNINDLPVLNKMNCSIEFAVTNKTEKMDFTIEYKKTKINQGLDDKLFEP